MLGRKKHKPDRRIAELGGILSDVDKRLATLRSRLQGAGERLTAARAARREQLIDGDAEDEVALRRAEVAVREAESTHAGFEEAVAELEARMELAKRELQDTRETAERERVAAEVNSRAEAIEGAGRRLQEAMRPVRVAYLALVDALDVAGAAPTGRARSALVAAVRSVDGSIEPAPEIYGAASGDADAFVVAGRHAAELRGLAEDVLAGRAPAVVPKAPVEFKPILFPDMEIVLREPITFIGASGIPIQVCEGGATIPEPAARAAMVEGIGHLPDSPTGKAILATLKQPFPNRDLVRRGGVFTDIGADLSAGAAA